MSAIVTCPGCHAALRLSEQIVIKVERCPYCQTVLPITAPSPVEPAAAILGTGDAEVIEVFPVETGPRHPQAPVAQAANWPQRQRSEPKRATWSLSTQLLIAGLVLGALVFGCGGLGLMVLVVRSSASREQPGRLITATDGRSRVRVPRGWALKSELNREAQLQVSDDTSNAYLLVLTESKQDFAANYTYRDHQRATFSTFRQSLEDDRIVQGPVELTINGKSALQYEFQGTSRITRVRIHGWHTTVDGQGAFHQILAWTIPSRVNQNRPILEAAIRSMEDLPVDPARVPRTKK